MRAPDLDAAAQFLAANARVLDRRRFERLFSGGDARPVRDGVAAFRNADGGFGHALEPDALGRPAREMLPESWDVLVVLLAFFLVSDLSDAVRYGVGAVLVVAVVLLVVRLGANRRRH